MFKRFWWMFLVMLPVGALLGFFIAAVFTYVIPKLYESEVVIELRPIVSESAAGQSREMPPVNFATEFEVIKSRHLLEKVVDNLDLTKRWNVDQETALTVLKRIVNCQNMRGTDLIAIRVRYKDKVEARDITLEIAKSYKEYLAESGKRDSERQLLELNKAIPEQEGKVEERRKVLATIVRSKGVREVNNLKNSSGTREEAIQRGIDAQDYVDAKRDFETDQTLLQTMKLKQINETISLKMPNESVVIHDEPVIADSPVSPNVTLNLVLGVALGFLISPLLALPTMWILNRATPAKLS